MTDQFNVFQTAPNFGSAKIGAFACQDCHFRDGRGSEAVNIPGKGMRLPPPVYGVGLLQWIAGAEVGLSWDGSALTVEEQTRNALIIDHGINPDTDISPEALRQLVNYTQFLTVPNRNAYSR